jgi:hypothetical protein
MERRRLLRRFPDAESLRAELRNALRYCGVLRSLLRVTERPGGIEELRRRERTEGKRNDTRK